MLNNVIPIVDSQAYLKRPHLYNLLYKSLQKPITTVVAGAGYGKTQAVYEFLQEFDAVTVWLQLSQFDNLPTRLWENFIYAISLQSEKLASDLKTIEFPKTMQEYGIFLAILSSAIKPDKKYVLVFDDFHLIYETYILEFIERFISARIPNLSIIIISREEPDINAMGLLSKDMLSITDEDALRFSKDEMVDYFQMLNIHISSKAISDVYNYTDGWAFAIRLVGLSLKKGLISEDYAISAARQNVFRLIEREVFSTISNELQVFLIKLSLIDNLPLELLNELSSHNNTLILEMTKISSFIRYDAFQNTYRIHHLFLDFLRKTQYVLKVEDKNEIYNKAADWYAQNGYNVDALTYYEKAGQYDKLLRIILAFYAFCSTEMAKYILDILNRLPENIYNEKHFIQVVHAKFVLNSFRFDDAYEEIIKIVKKYEPMPRTEENKMILGESSFILGIISFIKCTYTGDYDFQKHFKMADEYLPNGSTLYDKNNFSFNTGNYSCNVGLSVKGEFDKFIKAICYTMPYASRVTNGSGFGTEYLCLAEKSYFQGDLKNVQKYAFQAINESQKQDQYTIECLAIFYLVRANVSFGNYSNIMSLLNRFRSVCEKHSTAISYKILDITEGWFYSQIKQPDKAAEWIRTDMGSLNEVTTPIDYVLGRLVRAKCYLAGQKYYELLTFLDKHEELYGLNLFLLGSIEKKVLKAVALYQIKEVEPAIVALQEAYDLAAPDSLFMPFIELGSKMRTLAKTAMLSKNCAIPQQWLNTIITKSSSYAKRVSKIVAEYRMSNHFENDIRLDFTPRELEILTGLCHGLSREEIASDLNLSVNTVKSMLQNIFEKLGAINAIDAVRIATSLKLVK